jgi:hypothetical protein
MLHSFRDDLYTVVGTVDPNSKRATFQFHVNPLVSWIWLGVGILMFGAGISLWPEVTFRELGAWGYARAAAGVATGTMAALLIAMGPGIAYAVPRPDASAARPPPAVATGSLRLAPSSYYLAVPLLGLAAGAVVFRRRRGRPTGESG